MKVFLSFFVVVVVYVLFPVCLFPKQRLFICNFKFSTPLGISLTKGIEVTLYRVSIS